MNDLDIMLRGRMVAILRTATEAQVRSAARAIIEAGFDLIEITMNTPGALEVIRDLAAIHRGLVGAGTVLDVETADACIAAGARFIVSPHIDPALVTHVKRRGALSVPGALTPTEILTAWRAGADVVKVFPAGSVGGPDYFRFVRGPLPEIRLMPTGGVNAANARAYLDSGATAVGFTSELLPRDLLAAEDWDGIRDRAAALRALLVEDAAPVARAAAGA